MSVVDKTQIVTNPGQLNCPFSVPRDFNGTGVEYTDHIRHHFVTDLNFRRTIEAYVRFYQRHSQMCTFSGQFAREAKDILVKLSANRSVDQLFNNTGTSTA